MRSVHRFAKFGFVATYLVAAALAQEYDGEASGSGSLDDSLAWLNNYAYYEDPGYDVDAFDESYYDTYNYYGDYYYEEKPALNPTECTGDLSGELAVFMGTACSLSVKGGDAIMDKLKGGIDGVYKVQGCYEGKPYYKREDKEARFLSFNVQGGAWDFGEKLESDSALDTQVLVYSEGELGFGWDRPQLVPADRWYMATEHISKPKNNEAAFETHAGFSVSCVKGEQDTFGTEALDTLDGLFSGPLLTDEEMDSQFAEVYRRNAGSSGTFKVITTLMLLALAFFSLTMALGVPCLLWFKRLEATRGLVEYVEHQRKQATGRLD